MATRIVTTIVDDLDGAPLEDETAATVRFGLDGASYEIDLSTANAGAFREALAPYVTVATRVGGDSPRRAQRARRGSRSSELADIRAWASANGYEIAQRGRIPVSVVAAYQSR